MTDGRLMLHTFQQSHPLSSSGSWSLMNDSGADESAPLRTTPFPSQHAPTAELSATFDPALLVTPERKGPSHVPLQPPVPGVSEEDRELDHRATKVHFDQTVSVHHLSPEYGSNGESPSDNYVSELDVDVLSSMCSELNVSDTEPISVIASDLRHLSPNSLSLPRKLEASRRLQRHSLPCKNLSGDGTRKKKSKSCSSPSFQVVPEFGSTSGIVADSTDGGQDDRPNVESECVLARPEFNSTLKMSSEITQLQEQEFDLVAVTKEKISPKLKQQVFEKVLSIIIPAFVPHVCHFLNLVTRHLLSVHFWFMSFFSFILYCLHGFLYQHTLFQSSFEFLPARRSAQHSLFCCNMSMSPSRAGIVSKWLNLS